MKRVNSKISSNVKIQLVSYVHMNEEGDDENGLVVYSFRVDVGNTKVIAESCIEVETYKKDSDDIGIWRVKKTCKPILFNEDKK